jgi:outer membrane protein OmpA-like peptidoglycan-associated protein
MSRPFRFAAALLVPTLAWAAPPPKDCPPLGSLPDFRLDATTLRPYDTVEMERLAANGDTEPFNVSGRFCTAVYQLRDGKDTPSNLEIQSNYKLQLERLGAKIASSGGRNTYAVLNKDGSETWLRVYSSESTIETTVLAVAPPALTILPPGPGDYRLVGHLPNFTASKPVTRNFDSMTFEIDDADGPKSVTAEGKTFVVNYQLKEGLPELSNPELRFNYAEALRRKGAEILHDGGRDVVGRLLDNGQVVWLRAAVSGASVELSTLEEKPFVPSIKPAEIQAALQKAGRVALYVNFDFDKATLRPDAAPVVQQVLDLLKADPSLRLGIEGHTDAMGAADHNRTLSADRAKSFVAALVAAGIAPNRLVPSGFGPDKPITTNDTSEGRAKNRRVELVRL